MRISNFNMIAATVCLASLVSLFPTNAQPFPLPVGSVLGNIDSVSQLKPHIVLDFAGQCANVTDIGEDDGVMFPNNTECLFENFVSIQFPGPTYGDMCSPPNTTRFEIISKLHAAASQCQDDDFDEFIETAANIIMQVFSMESCFEELCTDDDSLLRVESNYIEHCADIRLPYPSESEFSMFLTEQEADDYVLTCMLDHVMHTSPFEFGLDSSPPVVCWPPGYDKIVHDKTICLDSLAPQSFDACSEDSGVAIVSVTGVKDDWFSMSMKMDDDYPYSYDDDHFDDDDDQYDDDGDKSLYERFCFILERLSTEQGLHCLANLCDLTALPFTDMPSLAPSQSPSFAPSRTPSALPSASPSTSPTDSHSSVPSSLPSASPSFAPTVSNSPSEEPSLMPSGEPSISSAPSFSDQPSSNPTTTAIPSMLPTTAPSSSPSVTPSAIPSASPSASPTLAPSYELVQQLVIVSVECAFSIEIETSPVIPELLDEVLEESLRETLKDFEDVQVTILTINGIPVDARRRHLQDAVDIEALIESSQACHTNNCTILAMSTIDNLNSTLVESFEGGSLTTLIQEHGAERGVDVLANSKVVNDSFSLGDTNFTLEDPEIVENPEETPNSSSHSLLMVSPLILFSVLSAMTMLVY